MLRKMSEDIIWLKPLPFLICIVTVVRTRPLPDFGNVIAKTDGTNVGYTLLTILDAMLGNELIANRRAALLRAH